MASKRNDQERSWAEREDRILFQLKHISLGTVNGTDTARQGGPFSWLADGSAQLSPGHVNCQCLSRSQPLYRALHALHYTDHTHPPCSALYCTYPIPW